MEVSRRAQVSIATVSRVLNSPSSVKPSTRERVLEAMQMLSYTPNGAAQALGAGRSYGVGVLVGDLASPYFGLMLRSIEATVRGAGLHALISNGDFQADTERDAMLFLRQRRAEAMIVQVSGTSDETLIEWARSGPPLVVFGRRIADLAGRCVYLDNEQGGRLATQTLLDAGHRYIAHVTGSMSDQDSKDRLTGYRQALERASVPYVDDRVVISDFTEEGGRRATLRLLQRRVPFTALFMGNDQMAAGALQVLVAAGLRVPHDVSLIGYDDVVFTRYFTPALTTVRQPLEDMGRSAAQLALSVLGHDVGAAQLCFEPELVHRQSVAPPLTSLA
ncbi:LacI family DNA-binding transcriptional regulator [Deinococcus sp.]|uniref:LacI family DNA-binding transcriptional regulator n=1 Tax=Deinococcus sp. TaxID=47478 RepID=UPI003B592BF2